MSATVTGARENRRGNGLTVPCKYKRNGSKTFLLEILLVEEKQIYKNIISSIIFLNQNVLSFINPLYPVISPWYGLVCGGIGYLFALVGKGLVSHANCIA